MNLKNNEQIYDEQIAPLMAQIIDICQNEKIPFAAQFVYNRDEENDENFLCTSYISFDNDHINKVIDIMRNDTFASFAMTITSK